VDASSERGQTTAEYAVVLGLLATGIVIVVGNLSGAIQALFESAVSIVP
jgi:Flp pilus assembly pilin Flp